MDEKRLIEITSEIIKYDGPLGRMAYISTLNENEIAVLKEEISNPLYEDLNIYDRVLKFSQDYLTSRNISFMNVIDDEKKENNQQQVAISYLEHMFGDVRDVYSSSGNKVR